MINHKTGPAHQRHGSELSEHLAPVAKTTEGYKSILVATITEDAVIRATPSGFRLITRGQKSGKMQISGLPAVGSLRNRGSIGEIVNMIETNEELASGMPKGVTPKTIREATADIPSAGMAWSLLNDQRFQARWIPDETRQKLLNLRGW